MTENNGQRIVLNGIAFDAKTEAQVVAHVVAALARGDGGSIVTPNVDVLRQAAQRQDLRDLVSTFDLVLADGMPVVWAAALQGTPLPERVTGSSLVWSLARAAAREGLPVFLLGGAPGVADSARSVLARSIPDLQIVGTYCPPYGFEDSPEELSKIDAAVEGLDCTLVLCGLSFPKQEYLVARLREQRPAAWWLGAGAGLAFVSGDLQRAPHWAQRVGLEWCFRLRQEPRRLLRRYLLHDLPYALRLLVVSAARRAAGRRGALHQA